MRVAVYHDLPSGGAKRTLYEFVMGLAAHHEIEVYSLSTAAHDFCDLRHRVHAHHVLKFHPMPLFHSPIGRLNQLQRWRDVQRLDGLARRIAAEIDRRAYDVVFAHPCQWTQAPLVLSYLRTPSLYYLHEPLRSIYEPLLEQDRAHWRVGLDRVDPLIPLYIAAIRRADRDATRAATRIVVNSEFTRRQVTSIYGVQATIAYPGVNGQTFIPGTGEQAQGYVLSVGAIQPRKGFNFLIESLATLPEDRRPPLKIVGNSEAPGERERLLARAAQCRVQTTIEVGLDQATLVRRYQEASLFLYAPANEPFGLAPLEAMACGKAVVGVAEGGVCETVVDGVSGTLTPRDAQAFGAALQRLLNNAELRERYGRQARQFIMANWTWEASVARIEQHLRAAAERRAA